MMLVMLPYDTSFLCHMIRTYIHSFIHKGDERGVAVRLSRLGHHRCVRNSYLHIKVEDGGESCSTDGAVDQPGERLSLRARGLPAARSYRQTAAATAAEQEQEQEQERAVFYRRHPENSEPVILFYFIFYFILF